MVLKILTLNVTALKWPLGLNNREKRMKNIAKKILLMESQPDVVCFQELFSPIAKETLTKLLKIDYPHYYIDPAGDKYFIGVNSGLAIFSKHTITKKDIHYYELYRGEENFAKKGVMGVQIYLPETKPTFIFTTHIQTGGELCIFKPFNKTTMQEKYIKVKQMTEAKRFIDSFVSDPNSNVFITGDFNIKSTDEFLYPTMINVLNVKDTFDRERSVLEVTSRNSGQRIDYILTETNDNSVGYSYITETFGENSDHRAVVGKFYI